MPRFSILAVLLVVAACALQGPYERPAVSAPIDWSAHKPVDATALWPERDWWRAFDDPALDVLAAQLLANNRDLQAAASRIGQARALARVASAARYPFITGSAGFTRTWAFTKDGKREREYSLTVLAGFEPDLWERFANLARSANATLAATIEAERVVRLTLTADAASLHFQWATLTERIALTTRTIEAAERIDVVIATRHANGAVSGLDRAQSLTNLATIRATLPPLVQARDETANALAVLEGRAPAPRALAPRPILDVTLPERLPTGMPSELLQRRPDIRFAEANLVAAHADIGVARANFYPRLPLTAETGFVSGQLVNLLHGASGFYTLAAALVAPVFQAGRLRAEFDRTIERREELVHLYQQTILGAFRDVENALVALERLAELEAEQRTAIEHAERTFELAEARYRSGLTDVIVLLTAQTTLLGVQNGLLQTRFARLVAHVNLFRALGGGL